ncbi:hypothetical protein BKH41_04545 [Helicobacter sp. 12S02232-10]|uniref:hypothetical protein n=1 Tax=Helicobacter sp. 12S02232-10 TaxID=1476197 RepID=UPI000BA77640|nr:hypothetical protein [Helicobacter sp. 12S02232-10]PAF48901.1 hypothetical protein BKH41_04545 [Helicobacter sp. 12S02232-10]
MDPNAFFIIVSFVIVFGVFFITLLKLLNKKKQKIALNDDKIIDYNTVMLLLDSRYSTYKDLQRAIEYFFNNYEKWDLNKSQKKNFLFALCLHKNANSKIILETQKKLTDLNENMKNDFEKIVKKAIDIR